MLLHLHCGTCEVSLKLDWLSSLFGLMTLTPGLPQNSAYDPKYLPVRALRNCLVVSV